MMNKHGGKDIHTVFLRLKTKMAEITCMHMKTEKGGCPVAVLTTISAAL